MPKKGQANREVKHAEQQGARLVEGYPVEPRTDRTPAAFAWTSTVSAFLQARFREVARGSGTRPIMRYEPGVIASKI
ncbi:MAG: hypothetical protein M3220_16710 [Chloroflexota bacterium]|nr:hypothetical protein [Chloroflexota bacterium]